MIDVHAHLYSRPLIEWLRRDPATAAGAKRADLPGADDSDAHLAARLAMMDSAGVARQVVSPPPAPYPREEAEGVALARAINDAAVAFVARRPDRFSGFACLPLPHVDASVAEARRCLGEQRMAGVMLQCFCGALSAADERFEPIYAELDRHEAVLLLHPCVNGVCSPFVTQWGLSGSVGPTFEDTTIALHFIAREIPRRHPRIKIIIPHFGGGLPMLLHRLDHQFLIDGRKPVEPPSVTSRRFWYDTVSHGSKAALACAIDAFGDDRIVMGSDFPFLTQYEPYAETMSYQRAAALSAEALRRIELANAESLLGF